MYPIMMTIFRFIYHTAYIMINVLSSSKNNDNSKT